jgi:hypothetical protein
VEGEFAEAEALLGIVEVHVLFFFVGKVFAVVVFALAVAAACGEVFPKEVGDREED